MNPIEYEKLRWQESETVRNLLKRQNTLLGGSLENLDPLIYPVSYTHLRAHET